MTGASPKSREIEENRGHWENGRHWEKANSSLIKHSSTHHCYVPALVSTHKHSIVRLLHAILSKHSHARDLGWPRRCALRIGTKSLEHTAQNCRDKDP